MKQLLKMYLSFNGRLNRMRYFLYGLPLGIIVLIAYAITMTNLRESSTSNTYIILGIYFFIVSICSISGISLSVRRLHDLDKTGWLITIQIFSLIPVLNIISLIFDLYLTFGPGTIGANQYGNDPLEYNHIPYDDQHSTD